MTPQRDPTRGRTPNSTRSMPTPAKPGDNRPSRPPPPIVGVGASAGGLEAFRRLLSVLPPRPGIAVVLIQHLDPTHDSLLPELLAKSARISVVQAKDGVRVEPDRAYVIPPNVDMIVADGSLHLSRRDTTRRPPMPIDRFFLSLAADQGGRAIGVILSGSASDGVLGLTAIKAEGGITFAQDGESASYASMPESATAAGVVDVVLPPEGIAEELVRIARQAYGDGAPPRADSSAGRRSVDAILAVVHAATGVDFRHYKPTTIDRRLRRRMVLHKMERLPDYLDYLRRDAVEVQALHSDLLINVTGFFRDPESFNALDASIAPVAAKRRAAGEPVRVWVPGCSTGEEAYSIAITLLDRLGPTAGAHPIQVFATDVNEAAIELARAGRYPERIGAEVPDHLLERYFTAVDGGFQIHRRVRDLCVFSRQDLTRDPPFAKLDLVSCRNVLIYLNSAFQKRVLSVFHFALDPGGILFLGVSETIGALPEAFLPIDRMHRLFANKHRDPRSGFDFPVLPMFDPVAKGRRQSLQPTVSDRDLQAEADRVAIARYAPASVVVSESLQILQFRGRTGAFLEPSPGKPSRDLTLMARGGLPLELRAAIQRSRKSGLAVRRKGITVSTRGPALEVNIEVLPLKSRVDGERVFLVNFEAAPTAPRTIRLPIATELKTKGPAHREILRLRGALSAAKGQLQIALEEHASTTEEMKSANEEILSSNEELQSTNEELETAKEELQSTNEELLTLNDEMRNRNLELGRLNNDLNNVQAATRIPIVILAPDLRIRRVTPSAEEVLNLVASDAGRKITDVSLKLDLPDLERGILDAVSQGIQSERQVRDPSGRWHSVRIRPYRTPDGAIEGAVLAVVDVDDLRQSLKQLEVSRNFAQAIIETMRDGVVVVDAELSVVQANRSFYETFRTSPLEAEGRFFGSLSSGRWSIPELLEHLTRVAASHRKLDNLEVIAEFPQIGRRVMLVSACPLRDEDGPPMVLLVISDITKRTAAESAVRELSGRLLNARDDEQRRIARELHDSTAQNLAALAMTLTAMSEEFGSLSRGGRDALEESIAIAEQTSREIRDTAALMHPPLLDETGLATALSWYVDGFSRRTRIDVRVVIAPDVGRLRQEVETAVFRIVQECLTNVYRHSGSKTAMVRVDRTGDEIRAVVTDAGRGMPDGAGVADVPTARTGIGILGMRERARQLGGSLRIRSSVRGTSVRISLPLDGDPGTPGAAREREGA